MRTHCLFRLSRQMLAKPVVDVTDRLHWLRRQVSIRHVDETVVAVAAAEVTDSVAHRGEDVAPEWSELVAGPRFGECAGKRTCEASYRCHTGRWIAMGHDEPGIRIPFDQRLQCDRVLRALQLPSTADPAGLQ